LGVENYQFPSDRTTSYTLDFEIEIGIGKGREYPLFVIRSPAGEAHETMHFPCDSLALEARLRNLEIALLHSGGTRRQIFSPDEQAVQDFGRQLFNALLTGEVRSRYDMSRDLARQKGRGLRLKLRILAPELARLPWEFLYDPRDAEYICLSRDTPIVRYLEIPQSIQPLSVTPPLKILGMVTSPGGYPALDVAREKSRVETAIRDLQDQNLVNLTWLEGQTWRDLQRAMRAGPWHVFHFIGHGGFDEKSDEGVVALVNENGGAHLLSATELGRLLADHHTLRMAILNSCEGARGSERDIFSSTAAILVRRGMPAVLAMQYAITDHSAIEFSRAFYEALADGLPVDISVCEARKSVSLAVTNTLEWGTPVLFMRSPQGVIFDLPERRQISPNHPESAPRIDKELEQRIDQLYTEGLAAFWIKDWDKACLCFQEILAARPDHADAIGKLEEARRQRKLNLLYETAENAKRSGKLELALSALDELMHQAPDFKNAASFYQQIQQQKQVSDLYAEAKRLSTAQQWRAVLNVFAELAVLDPNIPDEEALLSNAKKKVAQLEREEKLEQLYSQAVREMDAGHWQKAFELLQIIQVTAAGFRQTEKLICIVQVELTHEEELRQAQEKIAILYEQGHELLRSQQWRDAQIKIQEILALDPQFADSDRIAATAEEARLKEATETSRQRELEKLYAEAVRLVHVQQYQAALEKWIEVQAGDPNFPDRQKVQLTARKKLRELEKKPSSWRRKPVWKWSLVGLGVVGLIGIFWTGSWIAANNQQPTIQPTLQTTSSKVPAATITKLIPTITRLPTNTSSSIIVSVPTIDADPTVYDNFSNPDYDGFFNFGQWEVFPPILSPEITQKDGILEISNQVGGNAGLDARRIGGTQLEKATFFEASVKHDPDKKGSVWICTSAKHWDIVCGINTSDDGKQSFYCDQSLSLPSGDRINQGTFAQEILKGSWHSFRMDVDPTTWIFTYYVDGFKYKIIHPVSENKKYYTNEDIRFSLQAGNSSTNDIIGYFDNVRIGPVEK
jgi:hypothetical protein